MPANVYEGMFLLDPSKVSGDVANADKMLRTLLEKHGAEVLVSRPWDERRLSYQIGNLKKGLYYLTYFSAEGKAVQAIEADCKLNEMIIRQLMLRIPTKLVDTMLSIAKGEHAVALHSMHEESSEEGGGGGGGGGPAGGDEAGEGAPRRRPRERETVEK